MLKRTPSLTEQAKLHIKQMILDDTFVDGRIPAETDLAIELGVSRTTIRDALSRLEGEGVVMRKQGAGTFINEVGLQIKSRLDEIWSYEAMLADHGYEASVHILDHVIRPAPKDVAEALDIATDTPTLEVKKLFLADGKPVILVYNHIPAHLLSGDYTDGDLQLPVYTFLWEFGRQQINHYLSEIVPVLATGDLAHHLAVQPNTPLISFHEVGYNDDNQPIIKSTSCFRDDLMRLRLIRRQIIK